MYPCGLGWGCFTVQPRQSIRLLLAVQNFHDAVGGILASVIQLALPSALRRRPFETVPLQKRSGFIVGLAIENKLDTHCFDVLPVGVAVAVILDGLGSLDRFQLLDPFSGAFDGRVAVLQSIGRVWTAMRLLSCP